MESHLCKKKCHIIPRRMNKRRRKRKRKRNIEVMVLNRQMTSMRATVDICCSSSKSGTEFIRRPRIFLMKQTSAFKCLSNSTSESPVNGTTSSKQSLRSSSSILLARFANGSTRESMMRTGSTSLYVRAKEFKTLTLN